MHERFKKFIKWSQISGNNDEYVAAVAFVCGVAIGVIFAISL